MALCVRPQGTAAAHRSAGRPPVQPQPLRAPGGGRGHRGREVGFDLEEVDPAKEPLGIAERFFTPAEVQALRECREADRAGRFTTLWTVKEAVLKARGVGLGSGLGTVEIDLDETGTVRSVTGPEGPWTVRSWAPEPELRAALAVRDAGPVRVRTFRIVPLGVAGPADELGPPER